MPIVSDQAKELKSLRAKIDRHYQNKPDNTVSVKVPIYLKKQDILAIKPNSIIEDSLWLGCVYYILHSIISRTEKKKFKTGNKTKGYVALKFDYLRNIVGVDTKLVLTTLIQNALIESDGSFAIGNSSFGYRLSSCYRKSKFRFVTISDKDLVRRYNSLQLKLYEERRERLHNRAYLIKWFLGNTLKIDRVSAEEYLRLYVRRLQRNFKKYDLTDNEIDEVNTHLKNMVVNCTNVLDNWDKPKPTIDNKGGRLYSPLTSLMSQLRYFTTHEGQELVYFDIRNSQPFHMLALLSINFWEQPKKMSELCLHNLDLALEDYIIKESKSKYDTTIMTLKQDAKTGKHLAGKGLQRNGLTRPRFSYLVANGKLYKFISDELKGKFVKPSGFDPFGDDKLAKYEMIKMMYFNPKEKHSASKKYFAEFKKLFPTEAGVIELLKRKRYQDFSVLLQKVEAKILLGHVCKKIFSTNSKIPVYTIHDGIMTTKKHAETVKGIIISTYKRIMNVEPDLSVELINKEAASTNFNSYVTKKTREIFRDLNTEFKEGEVKLTLEDISDLVKSGMFSEKELVQFQPVYLTGLFPITS